MGETGQNTSSGMQYRQRKLQRSVTEMRKSRSGRPRASLIPVMFSRSPIFSAFPAMTADHSARRQGRKAKSLKETGNNPAQETLGDLTDGLTGSRGSGARKRHTFQYITGESLTPSAGERRDAGGFRRPQECPHP